MRPAKTQISLGISPVWSESSLSTWRNLEPLATHWVHSEDSDQTGRMPRLIWVFTGCTCHFVSFVMRRLIISVFCLTIMLLSWQMFANSVDPDQTACICIFWTHCSIVKPHISNLSHSTTKPTKWPAKLPNFSDFYSKIVVCFFFFYKVNFIVCGLVIKSGS